MILIKREAPHLAGEEQLIALFGVGLIGSAVARAVIQEGVRSAITLPFSWKDADCREADLASLSETMIGMMAGSVRHVEVVWTAGRAGFAAGWSDVEEELAAFETVNCLCVQLHDALPVARHRIHMMSSAGGLFEGLRFVEEKTAPAPRRPYGHLKLERSSVRTGFRQASSPSFIGRALSTGWASSVAGPGSSPR